MERLNWFSVIAVILLLLILCVLWLIKEVLEDKKETDPIIIRNTRSFRQFVTHDYFFRKTQRKVNLEIIKELQATYSEYGDISELKDELLGIKAQINEEQEDFGFIVTAILTLLLSLFLAVSNLPSAILLIPTVVIMGAVASYLHMLLWKVKTEETQSLIIFYMIPVILSITTIFILGILLMTSPADVTLIGWLFKLIIIEAIFLYFILLYEKVKYVHYLKTVSVVLNEMIMEKDRKVWMKLKTTE